MSRSSRMSRSRLGSGKADLTATAGTAAATEREQAKALRRWLADCERTVERLTERAAHDLDVEVVHELRVACRRTRELLGVLAPLLPRESCEQVIESARATLKVLAPLRRDDVAVVNLETLAASPFDRDAEKARRRLAKRIARERAEIAQRRRERVRARARRFTRAVHKLAKRLRTMRHQGSAAPRARGPSVKSLVVTTLSNRARQARQLARTAMAGDTEILHELRLALKGWRYAAEIAGYVLKDSAFSVVVNEMRAFQDRGGAFQDMADLERRIEIERERYQRRVVPVGLARRHSPRGVKGPSQGPFHSKRVVPVGLARRHSPRGVKGPSQGPFHSKSGTRAARYVERLTLLEQIVMRAREEAAAAFLAAVAASDVVAPRPLPARRAAPPAPAGSSSASPATLAITQDGLSVVA